MGVFSKEGRSTAVRAEKGQRSQVCEGLQRWAGLLPLRCSPALCSPLGPAAQLTRDGGSQREEFHRLGCELVHNLSHCSPTLLHV